jgi:hypothetical protein
MAQKQDSLGGFLSGLEGRLVQQIQTPAADLMTRQDVDSLYFQTPAPNAIEWAVKEEFGNVPTVYKHQRQYQIIRDFFQLRCPLCNSQRQEDKDCWGKSRDYLESENLLVWNKAAGEDACPSCKTTRSEFAKDGLLSTYDTMLVVAGMRSGKTATAAIIGTYVEHRVITIGHSVTGGLARYFDQLPKQPFEITFIASTDVQSADTVWTQYTNLRQNSTWIQKYIKWVKRLELEQQTQNGSKPWAYEEMQKSISNGFLNLKMNSLNSNSGGIAGRTRLAAFIDELSRFENTESRRGADEAYRVLENSLRTIRSFTKEHSIATPWLGTMVSITSPISDDDKAMRLLKKAPSIKSMYYGHYATWEFNPEHSRSSFDDAFEADPLGAMRDFGARPPLAASPLIPEPERFRELAIQKDLKPSVQFKKYVHTDRTMREYVAATAENAKLVRDSERYICFDAGSSFDQFAGACAHGEWVQTPGGRQLVTVYDWVFRLLPEHKPRRDVWFDFVVQSIGYMSKYARLARVEFDRWQSTYLIQQIRDQGIMCEMKSTDADQFSKFVNDVNYSRVRMLPPFPTDAQTEPPLMSPQGLAFYELEHLERSPDLKKVFNPHKGERRGWDSDDVATVVVHVNDMVQSSVVEINNSNGPSNRLRREQVGGHTWGDTGKVFHLPINRRGW